MFYYPSSHNTITTKWKAEIPYLHKYSDPFAMILEIELRCMLYPLIIKAKGGYLKNLKHKIYFDWFNTCLVTT